MQLLGIGSRVNHSNFGIGVVINLSNEYYEICFVEDGIKKIKVDLEMEILECMEISNDLVSQYQVERSLNKILQKWLDATEIVELGEKWKGGSMVLIPGKEGLASKEIPIESFFHKIVMMRDKLRVMEQKVNASELSDEAKIDIQQYISRCYGSMTTFNILFKEVQNQFKS